MSLFKKFLGAVALAASLAGTAQAVPLSVLLASGTLTAGDKLFDQWSVAFYGNSDPSRTLDPDRIDVAALDGGLSPGPGLRFTFRDGEFTSSGNDVFAFADLTLDFRVSVLDPALRIIGASLAYSGGGAFYSYLADGDSDVGSYVRQSLGSGLGLDDLATNAIEFSNLEDPLGPPVQTTIISSSAAVAPQTSLWVRNNLFAWARDATDAAGIVQMEQRFAQVAEVPEPATPALTLLGLIGLLGLRRRH